MKISYLIATLISQYQTNDPFQLAKHLEILIEYKPLGHTKGLFLNAYGIKMIILNASLPYDQLLQTCAHELGHAILHDHTVPMESLS